GYVFNVQTHALCLYTQISHTITFNASLIVFLSCTKVKFKKIGLFLNYNWYNNVMRLAERFTERSISTSSITIEALH
ncbi:MAG TPA: hypothetical protein PLY32_04015, partial [Salinivirgaceae bacterium]|nr:hypothetical protein [Salinivirgaceae bacterium]